MSLIPCNFTVNGQKMDYNQMREYLLNNYNIVNETITPQNQVYAKEQQGRTLRDQGVKVNAQGISYSNLSEVDRAKLQDRKKAEKQVGRRTALFDRPEPGEKIEGKLDGQKATFTVLPEGLSVIDGWYSPIEKKLLETKAEKQSANKWLTSGLIGKGDEAIYTGVKGWLEGKNPQEQVSKQEILDWMKDNRVDIVEVVNQDNADSYSMDRYEDFPQEVKEIADEAGEDADAFEERLIAAGYEVDRDMDGSILSFNKKGEENKFNEATKFSQYQLEGEKSNYKEVLVTLPGGQTEEGLPRGWKVIPKEEYEDAWSGSSNYLVIDEDGFSVIGGDTREDAINAYKKFKPRTNIKDTKFKSTHFSEPNILVHLRMNTRTDAEGKKVLFLEEVQSDWGQKGKKEGFKNDETNRELERLREELSIAISNFDKIEEELYSQYEEKKRQGESRSELRKRDSDFNKLSQQYLPSEQKMLEARKAFDLFQIENNSKVSTAPFVTDTNAWTKLGLKMALREAVTQGADKIAWTTGEQQNDRYDLSKTIEQVAVIGKNENDGKSKRVTLIPKDGETINMNVSDEGLILTGDYKNNKLEDVIGKELSEKVLKSNDNQKTRFEGNDLKIGGKGMKGFYDKIVPDVAKALVKELTGQKVEVGETKIDLNERGKSTKDFDDLTSSLKFEKKLADEGKKGIVSTVNKDGSYTIEWYEKRPTSQQSIDITPELKASLKRGQALFSKVTTEPIVGGDNPALKDVESTAKALGKLSAEEISKIKYPRKAIPTHDMIAVEHAGYEAPRRVTSANKNEIQIQGYGTTPTTSFLSRLIENGRLNRADFKKGLNIRLSEEYATKLLRENEDLFPSDLAEPKAISEAYHKAKADGSNPELVRAVEELLTAKPEAAKEGITQKPIPSEKEDGITERGDGRKEDVTQGLQGQGDEGRKDVNLQKEGRVQEVTPSGQKAGAVTPPVGQSVKELESQGLTEKQIAAIQDAETDELLDGGAEENRKKGKFTKDGITYERLPESKGPTGNSGLVKFADGVVTKFKYMLMEAADLQPSHTGGLRNPLHFIPEAQPKRRNDKGSLRAVDKISEKPDLDEAGVSPNAYGGAPVVNKRGEVIQGNNRSAGLKQAYDIENTSYKEQLKKRANDFGFTADQVSKMNQPVLVRVLDIDDNTAIELGNYTNEDIESGTPGRINPVVLARRMNKTSRAQLLDLLFKNQDPNLKTLAAIINNNASDVYKLLQKFMNPSQRVNFIKNDKITKEGVEGIEQTIRELLFSEADVSIGQQFDNLSYHAREGIMKSMPNIFRPPADKRLLTEMQNAISLVDEFNASGVENFNEFLNQQDVFKGGTTPGQRYSPVEIELARLFNNPKNQSDISNKFSEYAALVIDKPADMFGEGEKGKSKAEAIKEVFGVEYEPTAGGGRMAGAQAIKEATTEKQLQSEKEQREGERWQKELLTPTEMGGAQAPTQTVYERLDEAERMGAKATRIKIAMMNGFTSPTHLINSVNKQLGTKFTNVEDIPQSIIEQVANIKRNAAESEAKKHDSVVSPKNRIEAEFFFRNVVGMSSQLAAANAALLDARAEGWSLRNNKPKSEFYDRISLTNKDPKLSDRGVRGFWTKMADKTNRIIGLNNTATNSTFIHELLGHDYLDDIIMSSDMGDAQSKADLKTVIDEFRKATNSKATDAEILQALKSFNPADYNETSSKDMLAHQVHEWFAKGSEDYFRGNVKSQNISEQLKAVFERFKELLLAAINSMIHSGLQISEPMMEVYGRAFGPTVVSQILTAQDVNQSKAADMKDAISKQVENKSIDDLLGGLDKFLPGGLAMYQPLTESDSDFNNSVTRASTEPQVKKAVYDNADSQQSQENQIVNQLAQVAVKLFTESKSDGQNIVRDLKAAIQSKYPDMKKKQLKYFFDIIDNNANFFKSLDATTADKKRRQAIEKLLADPTVDEALKVEIRKFKDAFNNNAIRDYKPESLIQKIEDAQDLVDLLGAEAAFELIRAGKVDRTDIIPMMGIVYRRLNGLIKQYEQMGQKEKASALRNDQVNFLMTKLAEETTERGRALNDVKALYMLDGAGRMMFLKKNFDKANEKNKRKVKESVTALKKQLDKVNAQLDEVVTSLIAQEEISGELREKMRTMEEEYEKAKEESKYKPQEKNGNTTPTPRKPKKNVFKEGLGAALAEIEKLKQSGTALFDLDPNEFTPVQRVAGALLADRQMAISQFAKEMNKTLGLKGKDAKSEIEYADLYRTMRDALVGDGYSATDYQTDAELESDIAGILNKQSAAIEAKRMKAEMAKAAAEAARKAKADEKAKEKQAKKDEAKQKQEAKKQADIPSTIADSVIRTTKNALGYLPEKQRDAIEQMIGYLKEKANNTLTEAKKKALEEKGVKMGKTPMDHLLFAVNVITDSEGKRIWDEAKAEVFQKIQDDDTLSDTQKDEMRQFLNDYQNTVYDIVLPSTKQYQIVKDIMLNSPLLTITNEKGQKTIRWKEIIAEGNNSIDSAKRIIGNEVMNNLPAGSDPALVARIVDSMVNRFEQEITKRKLDIVEKQMLNAWETISGKKRKKKVVGRRNKAMEVVKMHNTGLMERAMQNEGEMDLIGRYLGMSSISQEQWDKLTELSERVNSAPTGNLANLAIERLAAELEKARPGYGLKLQQSILISNMLGSLFTGIKNATGFMSGMRRMIGLTLSDLDLNYIKIFAKGYTQGDFMDILINGGMNQGSMLDSSVDETGMPIVRTLEYYKPGKYNIYGWGVQSLKFVGRTMDAVDAANQRAISEMAEYYLFKRSYKRQNISGVRDAAYKLMYGTDKQQVWLDAVDQAIENIQNFDPTLFKSSTIRREAFSIIRDNRKLSKREEAPIQDAANRDALYAQYKTPLPEQDIVSAIINPFLAIGKVTESVFGRGASAIDKYTETGSNMNIALKFINQAAKNMFVPFIRGVANIMNNSLHNTPYGVLKGAQLTAYNKNLDTIEGKIERDLKLMQAKQLIIGNAAIYALSYMAFQTLIAASKKWDEEEENKDKLKTRITGSRLKEERGKKAIESAYPPNTITAFGKSVSFEYFGEYGLMAGAIANYFATIDFRQKELQNLDKALQKAMEDADGYEKFLIEAKKSTEPLSGSRLSQLADDQKNYDLATAKVIRLTEEKKKLESSFYTDYAENLTDFVANMSFLRVYDKTKWDDSDMWTRGIISQTVNSTIPYVNQGKQVIEMGREVKYGDASQEATGVSQQFYKQIGVGGWMINKPTLDVFGRPMSATVRNPAGFGISTQFINPFKMDDAFKWYTQEINPTYKTRKIDDLSYMGPSGMQELTKDEHYQYTAKVLKANGTIVSMIYPYRENWVREQDFEITDTTPINIHFRDNMENLFQNIDNYYSFVAQNYPSVQMGKLSAEEFNDELDTKFDGVYDLIEDYVNIEKSPNFTPEKIIKILKGLNIVSDIKSMEGNQSLSNQ